MIIKNLKKGKKNTYEITLQDGQKYPLYEDMIVKYRILPQKELTEQEFQTIKQENENLTSYYVALHYITIKLRTKKEIRNALKLKKFSKESIENTIVRLEQEGYLKESDYIRSFLNDSFRFTNDGPLKIQKKLLEHDFKKDSIEEIFSEIEKEVWLEKLTKVFQKKANSHHTDGLEKWQYKCVQYLKQLGYPLEWIHETISKINWTQDDTILRKEQEKLYRKLSRKYSGKELEFQINHRLYLKGFQKEEIEALKKER